LLDQGLQGAFSARLVPSEQVNPLEEM
jgi:hypothetical protein